MQIYRTSLYFFRIIADVVILIAVFLVSAEVSSPEFSFLHSANAQLLLLLLLIIWYFAARSTGLYNEFRSRNFSFEVIALAKNVIVLFISTIITLFMLKEENLSRYFVAIFSIATLILIGLEKFLLRNLLNVLREKGRNLRNLLIIGAGEVGKDFYELTLKSPHFGYTIIGFLDDKSKTFLNGQYLGKIDEHNNILNYFKIVIYYI